MTPSLAPTPVATAMAVGAARPRAQGHAETLQKMKHWTELRTNTQNDRKEGK